MNKADTKIPVAYLLDRYGKGGGTENQLAILLNNIDKTRFSSHLISLRPADASSSIDVSCPTYFLNVKRLASFAAVTGLFRLVRYLRKHRIRILQIYFQDSNILGTIAGRLAGIRNIVVNRRDMGWWYSTPALTWTNRVNRLTPYCLTNAEAVRQIVHEYEPFELDQIRVIHNGVDHAALKEGAVTRRDLNIPEGVPVVGIVANLKPIKRIDLFLRVARLIQDRSAHFVIIGTGPDEEALKASVASSDLKQRVTFYATVDHVVDVISLFDVGVLTSKTEGLSNVLIEYALATRPSVAFDTGGNKEVVEDGVTGYIIPDHDEELMVRKIDELLVAHDRRREMGRRARELALERFSRQRMVSQVEEFYTEICR
jgi:glycosyltransferase involved in cell wall biosynthesis